jgi:hypothetical protein
MIWTDGVGVKGDEAEFLRMVGAEREGGLERWDYVDYGRLGEDVLRGVGRGLRGV